MSASYGLTNASSFKRIAAHPPTSGSAIAERRGLYHLEATAFVEGQISLFAGLEIARAVCLVGSHQSLLHQRRAESPALKFGINPDDQEVPVRFGNVSLVDSLHCLIRIHELCEWPESNPKWYG